ncbi:phospholipase/carboxylesterase [Calothrix sp. NIES-4071]|nr:phospholipase/carboxylesterase [Calothrix sp. NIES-4071]BAZ57175.1 phospholipase/carboxylesterase [Calothrix sp. NIES-4105]
MLLSITYIAVCLFLYARQHKYLFYPSSNIEKTPAVYNVPFEEVWIPVSSKGKIEQMYGWWMDNSKYSNGKVLLYLHGNAANIGANVYAASGYYKAGFSVLLIDYRGFGLSVGRHPTESRVYEDANYAWNYLVTEKKVPAHNIYIYGHSLGGAVAIELATKQKEAAGLIVESTFTSIRDVIIARKLFRFFPVKLILKQNFDSISKISSIKIPILLIHGAEDSTVPAFMSKQLYNLAPEPKEIIIVPGANHNNVGEFAPSLYLKAVQSFLKIVEARTRPSIH